MKIFYHGDAVREFAVELHDPDTGAFHRVFDPAEQTLIVSTEDAERLIATGEWGDAPEKPAKKTGKTEKPAAKD